MRCQTSNFTKGTTGTTDTGFLRRSRHGVRMLNFVTSVIAYDNGGHNVTVSWFFTNDLGSQLHCESWASLTVLTDYLENRQRTLGKPTYKNVGANGHITWGWD